jgi:transcriptional regulator with XRE-family HTH domain
MNNINDPTKDWLSRPFGIAQRLREARAKTGLSGKDLAAAANWAASKVTRIETGQQRPSEEDVETWGRLCRMSEAETAEILALLNELVAARTQWRRRLRAGLPAVQESYNRLTAQSKVIRNFEVTLVSGLLQTPSYALQTYQAIMSVHGRAGDLEEMEAAIAKRLERQQHLYDTSKRFEFLLAEPVLRWVLCPPDVMRGQLDRLQSVLGLPNVKLGILPMGVLLKTPPLSAFEIYDDLAVAESFAAEEEHRGDAAKNLGIVMDRLWEDAVTGEDARALILKAIAALPDNNR